MEKKTVNQQIISHDVMRYKKNKLASMLALLGLAFNCLYFMILYAMPKDEYTTIKIGFSVIVTLVTLLVIFLSSEGVKGYNKKFSIVLLVVAAFQILRIFGYPLDGLKNNTLIAANNTHTIGYLGIYPEDSGMFFALMTIYLAASAGCLIASAVIGWIYAVRLQNFQKKINSGEVVVEDAIAAVEAEEAALAAAQAEATPVAEVKAEQPAEVVEVKEEQPVEAVAAEEAVEAEKPAKPAQTKAKTGTNAKPKTSGTKTAKKPADTDREVK